MTTATNEHASRSVTFLGFLFALAASLGSVWMSLALPVPGEPDLQFGAGLTACPLCFYQRGFALGVTAVLAVGLLTSMRNGPFLSLLALPMVLGGLGVALFHVSLEARGILECPLGVMEMGSVPTQSLAVFVMLTVILGLDARRGCCRADAEPSFGKCAGVTALVLGIALAVGSIASAPPLPPKPTKPYDTPLTVCRPPYVP